MTSARIAGIILIVLGAIGLAREGFSYTKDSHKADLGVVKISVDEKKHVHIPQVAAYAAIVLGLVLVAVPMGKKA